LKAIYGTHTAPDIDAIVALWLLKEYKDPKLPEKIAIFLKEGDEPVEHFVENLLLVDRGRGQYDHHRDLRTGETSASLVAQKLGITEDKYIQQLLGLVQRSDLQGISLPFDLSDIIKSLQRDAQLDNQLRVDVGLRLTSDVMEFRKKKLQRDNEFTQKIVTGFLAGRQLPKKFIGYLENLGNPKFERPFDLCEILLTEKAKNGERRGFIKKIFGKGGWREFIEMLLEFLYQDSANFYRARAEIQRKAHEKTVNGNLIIAGISNNPKFNPAARSLGASIIIQRNTDGHSQIYFATNWIHERLPDTLISMIRLEELLLQKRPIPNNVDLRKSEKIREVPEWYYYLGPQLGNKKAGKFLLNGALTAPNVPVSKIPLDGLVWLTENAIRYCHKFNWARWKAERIAFFLNNQKRGP